MPDRRGIASLNATRGMDAKEIKDLTTEQIDAIIDNAVRQPEERVKMKQGGAVTVPQRVQDHFLAYINPGEAAALRAMGGGITAGGGQQMMNGIPSFNNPQDDEGQGGDPTTPSTSAMALAEILSNTRNVEDYTESSGNKPTLRPMYFHPSTGEPGGDPGGDLWYKAVKATGSQEWMKNTFGNNMDMLSRPQNMEKILAKAYENVGTADLALAMAQLETTTTPEGRVQEQAAEGGQFGYKAIDNQPITLAQNQADAVARYAQSLFGDTSLQPGMTPDSLGGVSFQGVPMENVLDAMWSGGVLGAQPGGGTISRIDDREVFGDQGFDSKRFGGLKDFLGMDPTARILSDWSSGTLSKGEDSVFDNPISPDKDFGFDTPD